MRTRTIQFRRLAAIGISGSMMAVAIPALIATPVQAATQTVTITKSGFVPMNLTIKTGDTISFTNADTAAHEVLFKQTTGFTCTTKPVVVQPTTTQSCTWTATGKYTYSDPNQRGKSFKGSVTVDAVTAPSISLGASASIVRYGTATTLSGQVVPNSPVTTVDILAMAAGQTDYTKGGTATTTNAGAFSLTVKPQIKTTYRAEFQNGTTRVVSAVIGVSVRPVVSLALRSVKKGYANFTSRVTSAITYKGKYVQVQRKNSFGGWATLKRASLDSLSTTRFTVRLPSGTSRIRTLLPTSQAGSGYLSSTSRTILISR